MPLTLVAAAAFGPGQTVSLTFDRPINIAAMVVGAIVVKDGPGSEGEYHGASIPTLTGPATVRVPMGFVTDYSGPDMLLEAAAGNGIVAVDDGGTWAGVTDLVLPFP